MGIIKEIYHLKVTSILAIRIQKSGYSMFFMGRQTVVTIKRYSGILKVTMTKITFQCDSYK